MISLAKVQKYETELNHYQKKYQMCFDDFEKKITALENAENFEMEDDYLDWRFAVHALKIWEERKAIHEHA